MPGVLICLQGSNQIQISNLVKEAMFSLVTRQKHEKCPA